MREAQPFDGFQRAGRTDGRTAVGTGKPRPVLGQAAWNSNGKVGLFFPCNFGMYGCHLIYWSSIKRAFFLLVCIYGRRDVSPICVYMASIM